MNLLDHRKIALPCCDAVIAILQHAILGSYWRESRIHQFNLQFYSFIFFCLCAPFIWPVFLSLTPLYIYPFVTVWPETVNEKFCSFFLRWHTQTHIKRQREKVRERIEKKNKLSYPFLWLLFLYFILSFCAVSIFSFVASRASCGCLSHHQTWYKEFEIFMYQDRINSENSEAKAFFFKIASGYICWRSISK